MPTIICIAEIQCVGLWYSVQAWGTKTLFSTPRTEVLINAAEIKKTLHSKINIKIQPEMFCTSFLNLQNSARTPNHKDMAYRVASLVNGGIKCELFARNYPNLDFTAE
jgi:hypothetical protein